MGVDSVEMKVIYPDGKPDGVVHIKKTRASGEAVAFPRAWHREVCGDRKYSHILRGRPCVYALWRPGAGDQKPAVYVGESNDFADRIIQHERDPKKAHLTRAVVYTDTSDGSGILHLEARLWQCAKGSERCEVDNKKEPRPRWQNYADADTTEGHIHDLTRFFLPLAGCDFFRPHDSADAVKTAKDTSVATTEVPQSGGLFFLSKRYKGVDIEAQGRETDMGFVVYAGSQASKHEIPTFRQRGKGFDRQVAIRNDLIERKILTDGGKFYRFSKDHAFRSPWDAVNVIMGGNYTASKEWKDDKERTLGELQRQKG